MQFSWIAFFLAGLIAILLDHSILKRLLLMHFLIAFIVADLLDTVSTFVCVYFYGFSWADETNQLIQYLGVQVGFVAGTIIHTACTIIFSVGVFYGAFCVYNATDRLSKGFVLLVKTLFVVLAIDATYTATHNFLLPIMQTRLNIF